MKRLPLSLVLLLTIVFAAYAQHTGKIGICYINGKVEYSTDSKSWNPIQNMCKVMGEKEVLSVGSNSGVGITYKDKYFILDKSGNYTHKDLILLMEDKQTFNDYLHPKQEFIIKNLMEYYKNPDVYFMANNVNLRGTTLQSAMLFPADSELVLNNGNLFTWSKSDKPAYHLIIVEDFKKAPVFEITTSDTFARIGYPFAKDRIYYWCVNYEQNTVGFFSTFTLAGEKKKASINEELKKVSRIPKIDEVNRIMIMAIVYEDNKCYSEVDRLLLQAMSEKKYSDLKVYYGLYLKRRGYHESAKRYLD